MKYFIHFTGILLIFLSVSCSKIKEEDKLNHFICYNTHKDPFIFNSINEFLNQGDYQKGTESFVLQSITDSVVSRNDTTLKMFIRMDFIKRNQNLSLLLSFLTYKNGILQNSVQIPQFLQFLESTKQIRKRMISKPNYETILAYTVRDSITKSKVQLEASFIPNRYKDWKTKLHFNDSIYYYISPESLDSIILKMEKMRDFAIN